MPIASLRHSATIQLRVIHALVMREVLTRYGRHNIGILWVFAEPMLFTLGITTLWTLMKMTHGSSLPIASFAITGYSCVLAWRNASSRCVSAIQPNLSLLYHRNVKPLDIFIARVLLELLGATFSCVILTAALSYCGLMSPPEDLTKVIQGWLLICWFALDLGLILGAVSERSELVERVWHIVAYFLFPLSGAGYLLEWIPNPMRKTILYLPMVHGTEMLRSGFFGSHFHAMYDVKYLVLVNCILLFAGIHLVNSLSTHLKAE
jgi:capsular polysaccharide transport system permease protein